MGGKKGNVGPVVFDKGSPPKMPSWEWKKMIWHSKSRSPPGWLLWLGIFAMTVNGFYMIKKQHNKSRTYQRENRELQLAIFPYRKAESDRMLLGRLNADEALEAELMKDVEGWVPGESTYRFRWLPPNWGMLQNYNLDD